MFFSCKLYLSEKTHEIFSIKRKKTFRAFFTAEGLDTCADEPDFRFRKIVLTASADRIGYLLPFVTDFYSITETLFLCHGGGRVVSNFVYHEAPFMMEEKGPPESLSRRWLQTTFCRCNRKRAVVSEKEKAAKEPSGDVYGDERK